MNKQLLFERLKEGTAVSTDATVEVWQALAVKLRINKTPNAAEFLAAVEAVLNEKESQ